jgi:hypothetical protein
MICISSPPFIIDSINKIAKAPSGDIHGAEFFERRDSCQGHLLIALWIFALQSFTIPESIVQRLPVDALPKRPENRAYQRTLITLV